MSNAKVIIGPQLCFCEEEGAWPGVKRTADNVRKDIELVTGYYPESFKEGGKGHRKKRVDFAVLYGTIGRSLVLEKLEKSGKISLDEIRGKWEVYLFQIVEEPLPGIGSALVIAGSDKRGTIYGLYHLSERIGDSPLVNWNHVWPAHRDSIMLTLEDNLISEEPSVHYRGFFINDEWPAFGVWARTHFGGINAECYERVFELLLRLKGNYLWPAMWASNFNLDGPGLLSAQLADEYGVVMSTSHHEPCMRSGEEYGMVRGKNSIYGDDWNFASNPEGITRFWRDGLLRNREFENVITMGMRGENDTAILGKDATLADNIDLLRNVLKTQNELIRETVNDDLNQVPRQLVLFTEVEEFLYGSEAVPGLMGDPELDGVTLILSDNNHGYTRTLPTEEMRGHKGGYGMYYHMDMHGGAHSYQWIGSTWLPRVWEQMTMAYEYGVRQIWVTNIGDIGTQEFGLSFFMDLAYDIHSWGGEDASVTEKYTRKWLKANFGQNFGRRGLEMMEEVRWDYTGLLAKRKHETMNADTYHPVHFGEAELVLQTSCRIIESCDRLKTECPQELMAAFLSLIYYPACGTANLMKMWILTGRNALYAAQNRVEANRIADEVMECIVRDAGLTEEYHEVDDGYFNGFGLSEHIGFTHWNDDDNKYPVRQYVYPANRPRMILARVDDENYLIGSHWADKTQTWKEGLRPDVDQIFFDIACASAQPVTYRIETDCPWLSFSSVKGVVYENQRICLHIHKELLDGREEGSFRVYNVGYGETEIRVEAEGRKQPPVGVFLERDGYIAMEAGHFMDNVAVENGRFRVIKPYGRTGSGIKVFPVTADFLNEEERPFVEYRFLALQDAAYRLRFYLAPSTPVVYEPKQYIGFSVNDGKIQIVNTVKEEKQFFLSAQWEQEAFDSIKISESVAECRKGENILRFYGMSPAVVLERIILWPEGTTLPESYLGPKESFVRFDG